MRNKKVSLENSRSSRKPEWTAVLVIALVMVAFAFALDGSGGVFSHSALAAAPEFERKAGGKVLPPTARPHGYSLAQMAKVTAVFNTSDHSGMPPDTPIQMLYTAAGSSTNTFDVSDDTVFYVPVFFVDDSPLIAGDFPYFAFGEDAEDSGGRKALLNYVYAENELGVDSMEIKVDGKVFSLGSDYVVGVTTPPLSDGGGIHYIPIAAFLSPLPKGPHTVEIDGFSDGKALIPFFPPNGAWPFSTSYTLNVH